MSRPLHVLTFSLLGLSLTLAGCRTSTAYTRMYSPQKGYYVAPAPRSEKTAEELLIATDSANPRGALDLPPAGLPPADPNAVPGLPAAALPAPAPAADPLAPPPVPPAN